MDRLFDPIAPALLEFAQLLPRGLPENSRQRQSSSAPGPGQRPGPPQSAGDGLSVFDALERLLQHLVFLSVLHH